MPQAISTRWCPTPEQLMILQDMYRGGIRTPNASQIQQITNYLSFYGKIEGKNVFYWFQNRKARERQKLRKRLTNKLLQHLSHQERLIANNVGNFLMQPNQHFLHQQEASRVVNVLCKLEPPKIDEIKKPAAKTSGETHEWAMLEINPASFDRPLQTLELFPITSTVLKEEKSTTTSTIVASTTVF